LPDPSPLSPPSPSSPLCMFAPPSDLHPGRSGGYHRLYLVRPEPVRGVEAHGNNAKPST
jgi:hypothetical protein